MLDQTGRAYDEAQERAFRALPWRVRLKLNIIGVLALLFVLELVFIAFGWPLLTLLWEAE